MVESSSFFYKCFMLYNPVILLSRTAKMNIGSFLEQCAYCAFCLLNNKLNQEDIAFLINS